MPEVKKSAALGFIFITIFIDVLGLGIIVPVLPKLLQHLLQHSPQQTGTGAVGADAAQSGVWRFSPTLGRVPVTAAASMLTTVMSLGPLKTNQSLPMHLQKRKLRNPTKAWI